MLKPSKGSVEPQKALIPTPIPDALEPAAELTVLANNQPWHYGPASIFAMKAATKTVDNDSEHRNTIVVQAGPLETTDSPLLKRESTPVDGDVEECKSAENLPATCVPENKNMNSLTEGISGLHLDSKHDKTSIESDDTADASAPNRTGSQSLKQNRGTKKRQLRRGKKPDGYGDSSEDDSDDDAPKRKKCGPADAKEPRRRLRCPFYLHNPKKYGTMQACSSGMGFEDMSRLKYHLKRVHTQPLRCPCCQQEMASKAQLKQHLRDDQRCEVLPEPEDDRICQEKWEAIDSSKGITSTCSTVEEKYCRLYQLIFGESQTPPSPYERSFIMPELETELANALNTVLTRELGAMLPMIKDQIPSIVRACKDRLNGCYSETTEGSSVQDDHQVSTNDTFEGIHEPLEKVSSTPSKTMPRNEARTVTDAFEILDSASDGCSIQSKSSTSQSATERNVSPKGNLDFQQIWDKSEPYTGSNMRDVQLATTWVPLECSTTNPAINQEIQLGNELGISSSTGTEMTHNSSIAGPKFSEASTCEWDLPQSLSETDPFEDVWADVAGFYADPEWSRLFGP
ncbi:hypothetical protein N0V90_004480 [Kalmusia sp. IMI 367209]|nr:hypothetical protein N0V90_004480 [Kalmusia sp. IMI 367209]